MYVHLLEIKEEKNTFNIFHKKIIKILFLMYQDKKNLISYAEHFVSSNLKHFTLVENLEFYDRHYLDKNK
jgi:hypothetical protein